MLYTEIPAHRPVTPLLDTIDHPQQLRSLEQSQLAQVADELRQFILYAAGQSGGHFGANLGVVELTVALHYCFNTPNDRLIWDVGHQAYPHKALTGRREQLTTIRAKDGLAAFPARDESVFDTFGVGHSSTAISAGLGMALARRYQNNPCEVVAIIGDGAMTAGMAFEAMNDAVAHDADLVVVLNDGAFGQTYMQQTNIYGHTYGTAFTSPQFADIATACGAKGIRVTDPRDIEAALQQGLAATKTQPALVEVMVALPGQLFFNTPIPACLWFLAKQKTARPGEVLFIDARKLGKMISRVQSELDQTAIDRIANTVKAWRGDDLSNIEGFEQGYTDIPGFCRSVPLSEIAEHGHVLTPGRYVGAEEVEIDDDNVQDATSTDQIEAANTPTLLFMREFVQYDYAGIVTRLIDSLYEFGVSARAWDHLPLNPEIIEEILEQGPDEDGLFDIDGEMMSLEEARDVIAEFAQADDWGNENLTCIQDLFSDLTWADLSTGDY